MPRTKKKILDSNNPSLESIDSPIEIIPQNNKTILVNDNTLSTNNDIITLNDFKKKEKMLYEVLNDFFKKCSLEEVQMIIQIIDGEHAISLRFLDWFVTRYCYLYKLSINVANLYNKEQNFSINISYKAQLKSFKKRYFDPFRRKKKFIFQHEKHNLNILTTLGQLNFFRWALSYDIIKYAENNYKNINSKITYVNSYFSKNIDTNSLTISTSEEVENKKKEINSISSETENLSEYKKLSQNDINLIMDINNSELSINNVLRNKKIKSSKIFKELKNSQPIHKYPQVSRNISIEL